MSVTVSRRFTALNAAGLLFFLASSLVLMGIITAEIFYPPGYSTRGNDISDLGATLPPNSVITQPSATIFNGTMIVTGTMIALGALLLLLRDRSLLPDLVILILGFGMLGVGLFPGNIAPWHALCSLITFVSGGVAAILSLWRVKRAVGIVFASFGVISLIFLFGASAFLSWLGPGGTERWVAYPILLWLAGYGAYLCGSPEVRAQLE